MNHKTDKTVSVYQTSLVFSELFKHHVSAHMQCRQPTRLGPRSSVVGARLRHCDYQFFSLQVQSVAILQV